MSYGTGEDDMTTPTPATERRSPFDNHMPAVDEGAEVPEGVSPRTAAEAADKHTPLPPDQAPASRLRSRRSLDVKRSESMLLGQVQSGPPPRLVRVGCSRGMPRLPWDTVPDQPLPCTPFPMLGFHCSPSDPHLHGGA